jgi:hypothetical protein
MQKNIAMVKQGDEGLDEEMIKELARKEEEDQLSTA